MKTDLQKVNYEWLQQLTGDPFVDCGGLVLTYLFEKFSDKDLMRIIKEITCIYVYNWDAKIHPFFPDSTITQPAYKGKVKEKKTIEYFEAILNETEENTEGYCRILGIKTKLFPARRDNFILSGSGTFLNFHHLFEKGLLVSKEVIIRMFFVPLGVMYLGDKVALIQSNNYDLNSYWVYNNCKENLNNTQKIKSGLIKSEYYNPANALFEFANKCIRDLRVVNETTKGVIINLFHFTNYGPKPTLDIYCFPATVFQFYKLCMSHNFKDDWNKFIKQSYKSKYKQTIFNPDTNNHEIIIKKKCKIIEYEQYKNWDNTIYLKLLENVSIIKDIRKYSKSNKFNLSIIKLYQTIMRNMELKTLNKIEELAEFIIKDDDRLKKNIVKLNSVKKSFELRSFMLTLIKRNYEEGNEKPLITLTEYVEYLFPDGTYWADIRDLLLINIYQKLHEKQIKIEVPEEELITEE